MREFQRHFTAVLLHGAREDLVYTPAHNKNNQRNYAINSRHSSIPGNISLHNWNQTWSSEPVRAYKQARLRLQHTSSTQPTTWQWKYDTKGKRQIWNRSSIKKTLWKTEIQKLSAHQINNILKQEQFWKNRKNAGHPIKRLLYLMLSLEWTRRPKPLKALR